MFCPYIRKVWTRATYIDYDDEMVERGSVVSEYYINEECKKEECGVWSEGRCKYHEQ